jgi:hypothetical protein
VILDPQVTFTERDEGHDVLNPIRIKVLQLDLVVVEGPEEEAVGRSRKLRSWKCTNDTT